ncbi:MAG: PAS domain S-box protein [Lachnospiraceae bacterium]|nr:PAS domain S-box protein [Lachnospiraceae bacterium]
MYHCQIHFYLIGYQSTVFENIKEMSPLEHFTHEFYESDEPEEALAAKADVIMADIRNLNIKEAVQMLALVKKQEAELIVLADKEQIVHLSDNLSVIKDIWMMPMADEEVRFRFLRWQQNYKMSKDYWQTNQYLESTINNIPNLIWYKDKEGIHKKVNDSFCAIVNKTKQQVEGRGHAYIWDVEQDDPACVESELEVMSKRKTCISEEAIKTGDGMRLLTTYKSPLYNLDGSVMGTVGVAIDVTQERAYEQEIIKKNQTLETIFTTMDCGILCHTIDGSRIISINRAALKILGYESQAELMENGFDMIAASVVDDDREELVKCIEKLKKEGDSISVEYRVQHADGEILHVMGNIKLIKEHGELYYQRFLLDCTIKKLQEKKEQMKLIQALSIDYNLVCFFDLDTGMGNTLRITECENYVLESIFMGKLSLKESMERYIERCVLEDDRELLRQACSTDNLKKELAQKNIYHINYRTLCSDKIRYFQMKAVRAGEWEDSHGVVLGFHSVDEEIRNEMEKKRLLEEALLQANKANKAKSVFLSNMSHDIRTPMNAIVGFTNLAINHIDCKKEVEEYLVKIQTSGKHLLNLINDVLDMSRIESGKIHLEENPCSLSEILQGLHNILQADIREKQLELNIDTVHIQNEEIWCDKLRLNQVLLNLLSNAVKYTDMGGMISLRVTEKSEAPAGCASYEFYIKDTGIGMSKEFVSHIFEPFERERNSTISRIQGTGLGMAITKNIIDMMQGTIEVKSEQGVGTEVTVSFTFRLNTEKKADASEIKEKTFSIDKKNISTGRILLVEDIEMNQEIAVAILSEAGYCVEIAGNGQIAIDMLKNSEPGYYQLVLMDIQMPVMNGYEATKEIRKLENKELASIPILAMSANAFEEDKQEALKCGMNGHIAKPIDVKILFNTLSEILK